MSLNAQLQAVAAPQADASRVAAIRNSLDLRDAEAVQSYGERARLEVIASVERLLAEVRSGDVVESGDMLRHVVGAVDGFDPAELEPRGPAALFDGRTRRLRGFRTRFQAAAATQEGVGGDLKERADRLGRRAVALDRLHEQAKTFILELDAYLEAGRLRLGDARLATGGTPPATERLSARLAVLEAARAAAVRQLPLVRVVQNVDAPLADSLAAAVSAMSAWRTEWTDRLGLTYERRGMRIRPDQIGLFETKAAVLRALATTTAAVAEARGRREDAENQMEAAAAVLRKRPA